MKIWEPELKKFIIPTLLLLGFVFVLNQFYEAGMQQDGYACMVKSYASALELTENSKFCHVAETGYTAYGSVTIDDETMQVLESAIDKANGVMVADDSIVKFMLTIDPILPVPCEYAATTFCEQYMSGASHECMVDTGIVTQTYYRPASILAIIVNGMFLIVEGYVISCLICIPFAILGKGSGKIDGRIASKAKKERSTKPKKKKFKPRRG